MSEVSFVVEIAVVIYMFIVCRGPDQLVVLYEECPLVNI